MDRMRELSEEQVFSLAGLAEGPVIGKQESEPMEAAVCLKRFPGGHVLGASDRNRELKLWFSEDLAEARESHIAWSA